MEYLMTYGWAILIIAIILVALFSLGVFNSANFAPKAPPGSCQVFRPNGPGTTFDLNLEGECNGELPQYVATGFAGPRSGGCHNQTYLCVSNESCVRIGASESITNIPEFTYSVWFYASPFALNYSSGALLLSMNNDSSDITRLIFGQSGLSSMSSGPLNFGATVNGVSKSFNSQPLYPDTWYEATTTFNGTLFTGYINGAQVQNETFASGNAFVGSAIYIGCYGAQIPSTVQFFNGSIANVQFYNTSLSQSEVKALYDGGIGGAPVDILHIVGWWPLNGNAQDYSGNQNNGGPAPQYNPWTGTRPLDMPTYVTSWENGYSAP